jgi:hypothetical protein
LQFAPSTYYARKTRRPSRRSVRDGELSDKIVDLHRKNRSVYGLRKLWKAAIRDDIDVGRDHLGRLRAPRSERRRERQDQAHDHRR